ncbi:HEG protein, partial [Amia calva]|nr:HEG protein [Amia calva]
MRAVSPSAGLLIRLHLRRLPPFCSIMATCTSVLLRSAPLCVLLLGLFKPLQAGSYTDTAMETDSFTPNGTGWGETTELPAEVVSSSTAAEPGWGESASARESASLSGVAQEQQPLAGSRAATEYSPQTGTLTDTESWNSPSQTDSTYISSTFTRAGERTLLSVTTDSTSSSEASQNQTQTYTMGQSDQSSSEGRSTAQSQVTSTGSGRTEGSTGTDRIGSGRTEGSTGTHQLMLGRTDGTTGTNQLGSGSTDGTTGTNQLGSGSTDGTTGTNQLGSGSTDGTTGTNQLASNTSGSEFTSSGSPNVTGGSFDETSDSSTKVTSPFSSSHNSTESMNSTGTFEETSSSLETTSRTPSPSLPPFSSYDPGVTNSSQAGTEHSVTSGTNTSMTTESSTGPLLTGTDDTTEPIQPQTVLSVNDTDETVATDPPVQPDTETTVADSGDEIGSSSSTVTNSSGGELTTSETQKMAETTEVLTTTPSSTTQRTPLNKTQLVTPPPPVTTHLYVPSTTEESPNEHITSSATHTTIKPQTTNASSQQPSTSRTEGMHTQSSSGTSLSPTDITTLVLETSTATPGKTSGTSAHTTASYRTPVPRRTTATLPVTEKPTEKATTAAQVTSTTKMITTTVASVNLCKPNPCLNGGKCALEHGTGQRHCICTSSWKGDVCSEDVDECGQTSPCPAGSMCVNTHGSFTCECALGYQLEKGRTCALVKTFLGTFKGQNMQKNMNTHEIQREIILMLNASLSHLRGYSKSTVHLNKSGNGEVNISAVNIFSINANVTHVDVHGHIDEYMRNCVPARTGCGHRLWQYLSYEDLSLCARIHPQCDTNRSTCTDTTGIAVCQCKAGYFKYKPDVSLCGACDDGFKLENGTCVSCPFGFGGFNCGNFYKLITVVVSSAGGGLLLVLLVALIVTCCR